VEGKQERSKVLARKGGSTLLGKIKGEKRISRPDLVKNKNKNTAGVEQHQH